MPARHLRLIAKLPLLLACCVPNAQAEVTAISDQGFAVHLQAEMPQSAERIYMALTEQVSQWWSPDHTRSGDSANLYMDIRPGGCFCERLPNSGWVEHLRVLYVIPNKLLRLGGGLGPLQDFGLTGSLTWTLKQTDNGTSINLSYQVSGFMQGGFAELAPAVDQVLGEQLQRLTHLLAKE